MFWYIKKHWHGFCNSSSISAIKKTKIRQRVCFSLIKDLYCIRCHAVWPAILRQTWNHKLFIAFFTFTPTAELYDHVGFLHLASKAVMLTNSLVLLSSYAFFCTVKHCQPLDAFCVGAPLLWSSWSYPCAPIETEGANTEDLLPTRLSTALPRHPFSVVSVSSWST